MISSFFVKNNSLRVALLATTVLGCAIPASHAANNKAKTVDPIQKAFQEQYGNRFDTGKLVRYLNQIYSAVDFNRNGLEKKEIILYGKMQSAQARARIASQVLRYDLDGDGIVTKAEIQTYMSARRRPYASSITKLWSSRYNRNVHRQVNKILQGDPNNDGRIEPSEYGALAKISRRTRYLTQRNHSKVASALLDADPNKDGVLSQIEAMTLLGRVFQGVTIKPSKLRRYRIRASCKAPKAAANDQVMVVGAYAGNSVPTVTIVGPDRETSAGKIVIEEGTTPIYLVMTSAKPMIWRLSGATKRISRVLVAGQARRGLQPAAGVVGVAKDKVTFLSARGCINAFYKVSGITGAKIKSQVSALAGHAPEKVVGFYTLHELSLPSGRHSKARRTGGSGGLTIVKGDTVLEITTDEKKSVVKKPVVTNPANARAISNLKRNFLRYKPGGVVKIDAKSVVSNGTVAAYKVLPQQAGLLQLVESGALEVISRSEYRIVKAMRYPPGLIGGLRQKFLLKKGVPEPTGNPGRSCVFSEDKGGFIAGRCR